MAKEHKRGALKVTDSDLLALWVPKPLKAAVDSAVVRLDTDRSKFIRAAIREKIAREIPEGVAA